MDFELSVSSWFLQSIHLIKLFKPMILCTEKFTNDSMVAWNQQFIDWANWVISLPVFHDYGLWILFIYVILPTDVFPIPIETFMIPLILAKVNLTAILLVAWVGEVIGSIILYWLAFHGYRKLTKERTITYLSRNHPLFKYRFVLFTLAPIIYVTGDIMMIYAGVKHIHIKHFILPLTVGVFVRALIGLLISLGILALPSFLK